MKSEKKPRLKEEILTGIGVSTGIAMGPAYIITQRGLTVPEYNLVPEKIDEEIARFHAAIVKTQKQLSALKQKAASLPDGVDEEIGLLLEAYKGMVSSSRLSAAVEKSIAEGKINAEAAVQKQIDSIAEGFAAMKDDYLAARADDVREVGARLIRNLMQQSYNPFADAPEGCILLAEDITPADTALMDPARIAGVAAVLGGPEGHAAIMTRALGLPSVLGVSALVSGAQHGDLVIVDGHEGKVILRPTAATQTRYKNLAARLARETEKLQSVRAQPSATLDSVPITLMANLELERDVDAAFKAGAVGVGLLRTEFSFMNRTDLPSEEEQFETLRDIIRRMKGKPITIRTLDVGGEKLASALGDDVACVNPALGLRAIRLGLAEPKLLDTQLAAILRASVFGPVRVLIPMVSSVDQMRQVRERFLQVEKRLHRRGGLKLPDVLPPLGAMIEIPAAALSADALSKVCDFFAIGSNDLTQYTLAIDRGDDRVAPLFNAYHPAVLRLIQFTIAAAWRANIPVSVCGEIAGDPKAAALLLGLGLREFSMSPSRLLPVKQAIRNITMPQAVDFAQDVMRQSDEDEVRTMIEQGLKKK
ncbi:MAG: phosphoenolpyruvate--protein phosphotransferase [Alphaproteobacteria bacterium]|nr:phosphoenolpyruvate--protein phosphotransferase [Alphaproteobacteria bacterium]